MGVQHGKGAAQNEWAAKDQDQDEDKRHKLLSMCCLRFFVAGIQPGKQVLSRVGLGLTGFDRAMEGTGNPVLVPAPTDCSCLAITHDRLAVKRQAVKGKMRREEKNGVME